MTNPVQAHYEQYPYPHYPLFSSVRRCDTYALNLNSLWARFNRAPLPPEAAKILIAGCGTFAPYPCAVANPDVAITALDLSGRSLRRARMHCLLHGVSNVEYRCGDLSRPDCIDGTFGMVDSFGVLHHLDDPLAGLKMLERRLAVGGIIRIMLYSRYARREEESIRRALKLLGIKTPRAARLLLAKAKPGSSLAGFLAASDEAASNAGLADALLHPCAHTFRIADVLDMVEKAGLEVRLFAHGGAREDVQEEIERIRLLELYRKSPGNFILYLSRKIEHRLFSDVANWVTLNPCLHNAVSHFRFGTVKIPGRLGQPNPALTSHDRKFLRRFIRPFPANRLSGDDALRVAVYRRLLFLVECE